MSSIVIEPLITINGKNSVIAANGAGLSMQITHVSVGDQIYEVEDTQVALQNEKERVQVTGGHSDGNNQFQVDAVIEGPPHNYVIGEVGFWFDDILFAVWSAIDPYGYANYPQSNIGNGLITKLGKETIGVDAQWYDSGNYQLTCTDDSVPGSEVFSVLAADGVTSLGAATVDVEFTSTHLDFTIEKGGVDFQVGDQIQITLQEDSNLGWKSPTVPFYFACSLLLEALPAGSVTIDVSGPTIADYDIPLSQIVDSQIQQNTRQIQYNNRLLALEKAVF